MRVYIDIEGWHYATPSTPDRPPVEVPTPFMEARRLVVLRVPIDVPDGGMLLRSVAVVTGDGEPIGAALFSGDGFAMVPASDEAPPANGWAIARDRG